MESIVAGSYDRFLFGFQCSTSGRTDEILARSFTYPAHKGPIKCVAASAPYLVSGGADDLIHLYDLQSDVDLGFLMSPGDGAVSALAFHATDRSHHPSHLLSGSADGSLSVWQAGGEWVCLKTFHGHRKEVHGLAVHPSGRLALSVSADSNLRLWNLVKGKCAQEKPLLISADCVAFSPSGTSYALTQGHEVVLQNTEDSSRLALRHPRRAQSLAFPGLNAIVTGCEDGTVTLWDSRAAEQAAVVISQAHKTRVKGIAPLSSSIADQQAGLVASAASDGSLKLWDFRMLQSNKSGVPRPIALAATGARLTCLTAVDASSAPRKRSSSKAQLDQKKAEAPVKATPKSLASRLPQAAKSNGRQIHPQEGVAHNGVVDFPDEIAKGKQKRKKKDSAIATEVRSNKLSKEMAPLAKRKVSGNHVPRKHS